MSSTSCCCQGLQSCLEPARLVEPRVLRLKMATAPKTRTSHSSSTASKPLFASFVYDCDSKSNKYNNDNDNDDNNNVDMEGGWSFLQSLANNTSQSTKDQTTENDAVYIPPSAKRPSSSTTLCTKSLEMCTESLGSETGSDVSERDSDEMALLASGNVPYKCREKRSKLRETNRMNRRSSTFPPPLTSISGSTNVQVRPHREGGRLVLKAVTVSCSAFFHAERNDGRLRLHFITEDCSEVCGDESDVDEGEDRKVDVAAADDECRGEEVEGNGANAGGEMDVDKLPRPSRCKEGGGSGHKGLLNWETFLVATST